jgi:glycosyltransferase involved in cell wall biosynthesis
MISLIFPAYNEAFELDKTLQAANTAAKALGYPFELIVVNDASTDKTPDLARKAGARVVDVQLHQIAAVRNAGARVAQGDVLFFIDADTRISEPVLREAMQAIDRGAVGGGAWVEFAEPVPFLARFSLSLFAAVYGGLLRWAAGCFVFVRKDAFNSVGGFNATLYAGEEIFLSIALKKQGRFIILRETVRTSGRKLRLRSPWDILPFGWRFLRQGMGMLRRRDGLDWWYDGKRES